jgi:hypothetical protein
VALVVVHTAVEWALVGVHIVEVGVHIALVEVHIVEALVVGRIVVAFVEHTAAVADELYIRRNLEGHVEFVVVAVHIAVVVDGIAVVASRVRIAVEAHGIELVEAWDHTLAELY